MAGSLNPFRKHKNVLIYTTGLTVEIIRNIVAYIDAYMEDVKDEAELGDDIAEWRSLVKSYDSIPQKKKKKVDKQIAKLKRDIDRTFPDSLHRLDAMFAELMVISKDADIILYRELENIIAFKDLVLSLEINPHYKLWTEQRLLAIANDIASALDYFWVAAKAQARGWVKIAELVELKSTKGEKRRMKMESIEIRGIESALPKEKKKLIKLVNTQADHKVIHEQIHEIIESYEHEYHDVHKIMHRAKILIHRTEKMLNLCAHYGQQYGDTGTIHSIEKVEARVKSRLNGLVTQTRRQLLEARQKSAKIAGEVKEHSRRLAA